MINTWHIYVKMFIINVSLIKALADASVFFYVLPVMNLLVLGVKPAVEYINENELFHTSDLIGNIL